MNTLQNQNSRNYLWDNMKAFLIFLVVIGHFLETFPLEFFPAKALNYWIYVFHMPAFLFISGFLSKGFCKNSTVRYKKIGNFIAYYLIFQFLFYLILLLFNPKRVFSLFTPNIGLWYLFAMIVYYLLIPILEKIPAYITLPVMIILSLQIGTEKNADSFMTISRIFVFAPFFYAGYYTPESLIEKLRKLKSRYVLGIASSVMAIIILATIMYLYSPYLVSMELFYGKSNYLNLGVPTLYGFAMRTIALTVSSLITLSMIFLTTEKKNIFSYVGQRSLQIYLFHFILVIFLVKTTFTENFPITNLWEFIALVLCGTLFTLLLSIKPFSYPFDWIRKLVDKLYSLQKEEE